MLACHTDDVEGGEGLESEERLARIAVLGRASASLALPLLTGQLHGCLVQLQQSMQSGGRAFAHHTRRGTAAWAVGQRTVTAPQLPLAAHCDLNGCSTCLDRQ